MRNYWKTNVFALLVISYILGLSVLFLGILTNEIMDESLVASLSVGLVASIVLPFLNSQTSTHYVFKVLALNILTLSGVLYFLWENSNGSQDAGSVLLWTFSFSLTHWGIQATGQGAQNKPQVMSESEEGHA